MSRTVPPDVVVGYPCSDDQPMAESEFQLGPKRALYASLGVAEYWLFDPTREHLSPPLRGLRLAGREYRELPVLQPAASAPTLRCEVLGLDLRLDRGALRFLDAAAGEDLLGHEEVIAARRQEAAARKAAEAQIADLQVKLRDLRGGRTTPGEGKH